MTRLLFALTTAVCVAAGGYAAEKKEKKEAGCFGTTIDFVDSPKEAAAQAKKEEKLVFVLHVSGHFEDPKLT